jgi:hypothetical protein
MGIRRRVKVAEVALLCAGIACAGHAQELAIQSFNGTGQLTFNTLNSATNYRIECATSPAGPWSDTWAGLVAMPPASSARSRSAARLRGSARPAGAGWGLMAWSLSFLWWGECVERINYRFPISWEACMFDILNTDWRFAP